MLQPTREERERAEEQRQRQVERQETPGKRVRVDERENEEHPLDRPLADLHQQEHAQWHREKTHRNGDAAGIREREAEDHEKAPHQIERGIRRREVQIVVCANGRVRGVRVPERYLESVLREIGEGKVSSTEQRQD